MARSFTQTIPLAAGGDDASVAELEFVGATTTQGEVSEAGGVVTFRLGRLGLGRPVPVELTLRPRVPGTMTNRFEIRANGLDSRSGVTFTQEILFAVVGDPVPVLTIERLEPGQVRLKVAGQPGAS